MMQFPPPSAWPARLHAPLIGRVPMRNQPCGSGHLTSIASIYPCPPSRSLNRRQLWAGGGGTLVASHRTPAVADISQIGTQPGRRKPRVQNLGASWSDVRSCWSRWQAPSANVL